MYKERAVCTFWWALSCHYCLCLFSTHMYLAFEYFSNFYYYWCDAMESNILILQHQNLVLPAPCAHHLDMCHEVLCIFHHPLVPACFGFCISTPNSWVSPIMNSFLHWAGHLWSSCLFLQYWEIVWVSLLPTFVLSNVLFPCSCGFMHQNLYSPFWLLSVALWALCSSTFLAHANTCWSCSALFLLNIIYSQHKPQSLSAKPI